MRRPFASILAAFALCACASAPAEHAETTITDWARAAYGERLREPVSIFYGDFTGDGSPDAMVWVMYNDGGLRNFPEAALFRNRGGRMVYWRTAENAVGGEPRDVAFARGRISVTTTVWQDGDPRCCPTGARTVVIETAP